MEPTAKRSLWIRFVSVFLLWTAGRAVFFLVLRETDPTYRMTVDAGYGPVLVASEVVYALVASAAGVSIYLRRRFAFMLATGALALYTGLTAVGILQSTGNLPAAREAYKASREARGIPITDERLDAMFSRGSVPLLWITGALLCIPPYLILLWRKRELDAPEDDE